MSDDNWILPPFPLYLSEWDDVAPLKYGRLYHLMPERIHSSKPLPYCAYFIGSKQSKRGELSRYFLDGRKGRGGIRVFKLERRGVWTARSENLAAPGLRNSLEDDLRRFGRENPIHKRY